MAQPPLLVGQSNICPPPPCYFFRCVYCGTPTTRLYRHLLSSSHSIKLTTCSTCNQIVDPYIEREVLLIVIDCILLREEAYRHVLYNRLLKMITTITLDDDDKEKKQSNESSSASASLLFTWKKAIQILFAWTILDTYIVWESFKQHQHQQRSEGVQEQNEELETATRAQIIVSVIATISFFGMLLQWICIYWYLSSQQQRQQQQQLGQRRNEQHHPKNYLLGIQIYMALILPSSFAVVTILVLIWENTKTVRLLGTVLVACWQCLALSVLCLEKQSPKTTTTTRSSSPKSSTSNGKSTDKNAVNTDITTTFTVRPYLVGLFVRIVWRLVGTYCIFQVLLTSSVGAATSDTALLKLPCVGLEIQLPTLSSLRNYSEVGGGEGEESMVSICLT